MKKTVVLVGDGNGITADLAHMIKSNPAIIIDATIRPMETDGERIFYDPKMIESMIQYESIKKSDRITNNLPERAKKPTFLLAQNHHIRKVRK